MKNIFYERIKAMRKRKLIISYLEFSFFVDTKDDKTSIESFINKPRKDMKTAVFLAAEMGHITAMQKLIEEGADIFVQSSTKTTLLHLTASAGNENAVRFLLKKGISSNTVNNKRRTPLHE